MWNDYVLLYTDISLVCGMTTFYYIQRYKSCMWSDYVLLYTDISLVCGVTTFYYIQI